MVAKIRGALVFLELRGRIIAETGTIAVCYEECMRARPINIYAGKQSPGSLTGPLTLTTPTTTSVALLFLISQKFNCVGGAFRTNLE